MRVSATMTRVASARKRTVSIDAEQCGFDSFRELERFGRANTSWASANWAVTFEIDLEQVIGILSLCVACNLLQRNILLLEEFVAAPNTKHDQKEGDT